MYLLILDGGILVRCSSGTIILTWEVIENE